MDHQKIEFFLQNIGADYINCHRNPPASSHMRGVWERKIRLTRTILMSLLHTHGRSLNDESLRTLLAETEAIVNSRPLTVDTLGDVQSEQPICPSNILTMKSKVVLPPPGHFVKADEYSRKRWRHNNKQPMNSGLDIERNFCGRFSLITNGTKNIEISKMVILFY